MLPETIIHQVQPTVHTCGHAVIAMLRNIPVADVVADLGPGAIHDRILLAELARGGIAGAINRSWSEVIIYSVPSFNNNGWLHYILADYRNGRRDCFDPVKNEGMRWTLDLVDQRGPQHYISVFDYLTAGE